MVDQKGSSGGAASQDAGPAAAEPASRKLEVELRKIEVETEKVRAEIEKVRAEALAARRPPLANPTTWVSLLVGLAGLGTAMSQFLISDIKGEQQQLQLDRAKKEKQDEIARLEEKLGNAQSSLAQINAELEAKRMESEKARTELQELERRVSALAETARDQELKQGLQQAAAESASIARRLDAPRPVVFIQFKGDMKRATMYELQGLLRSLGFQTPGVERVDAQYRTEVLYFDDAYAGRARDVAATVAGFLTKACGLPPDFRVETRKVKPGRPPEAPIEVWVAENCQARP